VKAPVPAGQRLKEELDLRAELKKTEVEMAEILGRIKKIDTVLNQGLSPQKERGSQAAIGEYLAWLDRVEALGLAFVNANIVTQGLRLFYQSPRKLRRRNPEPTPRMKEVKDLLETVRHREQANLLLLRARRHSLATEIQHRAGERKTGAHSGGAAARAARRAARAARIAARRATRHAARGSRSVGWLTLAVFLAALLIGNTLLEAFKPEIVQFIRSHLGLQSAAPAATPAATPAAAPAATPAEQPAGSRSAPKR